MSSPPEWIPWIAGVPVGADPALLRTGTPWRVVVDLNEACNINCSYCHINALWGKDFKNGRVLPLQVFADLVSELDALRVFDLTITGGEVTVMPDFEDYLGVLAGLRFTSSQVITNGITLSPSLARKLKSSGLTRVSISIDGLETEHDSARGRNTWLRAWAGLLNALEAGLTVNVISVLGLHNVDAWHQLPPLLKEVGVRSHNVSLMCRLGRAESAETWMGVPQERVSEVHTVVAELRDTLEDEHFTIHFNDGVLRPPGWSGMPTPLHAFQDQNPGIEAVVKVDGGVLRNRIYGAGRCIGNICERSLRSLWDADGPNRAELKSTIGRSSVSDLPNLYYHYDSTTGLAPLALDISERSTESRPLLVREESWGKAVFDRSVFSIVGVYLRNAATA